MVTVTTEMVTETAEIVKVAAEMVMVVAKMIKVAAEMDMVATELIMVAAEMVMVALDLDCRQVHAVRVRVGPTTVYANKLSLLSLCILIIIRCLILHNVHSSNDDDAALLIVWTSYINNVLICRASCRVSCADS